MSGNLRCERPDHDVPGIICGHPLPCPYHTATIDVTGEVPTVTIPVVSTPSISPKMLSILKEIGSSIHEAEAAEAPA